MFETYDKSDEVVISFILEPDYEEGALTLILYLEYPNPLQGESGLLQKKPDKSEKKQTVISNGGLCKFDLPADYVLVSEKFAEEIIKNDDFRFSEENGLNFTPEMFEQFDFSMMDVVLDDECSGLIVTATEKNTGLTEASLIENKSTRDYEMIDQYLQAGSRNFTGSIITMRSITGLPAGMRIKQST